MILHIHKLKLVLALAFVLCCGLSKANNPYQKYLLAKLLTYHRATTCSMSQIKTTPLYTIPRYQIPKGNVFCRMEDKLTKATGVWIKVGVK